MESITYHTSHDRAIKTATRRTGAVLTTRGFEDGVTTFSAKNAAGKVVVSGKVAGPTADVTFATKPVKKAPKATTTE
jgi:hypothetical protein